MLIQNLIEFKSNNYVKRRSTINCRGRGKEVSSATQFLLKGSVVRMCAFLIVLLLLLLLLLLRWLLLLFVLCTYRLGNECFSAKKFDEAILHYTAAIKEDPENAVYYSNRSACFFSLKKWEAAGEDAATCVQKDSSFVKGYYRLALALTEQGLYDDASSTLLNASKLEPDNAQLLKQLRVVRAKKAAQAKRESAAKGPQKELDDNQRKEVSAGRVQPVLWCDVVWCGVVWCGVVLCCEVQHITF